MMIKKAALSLFVIGASGAYVWTQSATRSGEDLTAAPPAAAGKSREAVAAVAVEPPLIVREFANSGEKAATAPFPSLTPVKVRSVSIDPEEANPAAVAAVSEVSAADNDPATTLPAATPPAEHAVATLRPRLRVDTSVKPIQASAAKPHHGLTDGTFDGPAVDAFYGLVQIEANVQNGKLASIKVLQFPSDRRTSIMINRQALPILRLEAIAAQSASVDIVSGATLTSEAFIESLGAALRQASA